ncbi:hypothetical protein OCHUTO_0458 [Orientia chuto str. Dubai]|uniref:Uncharacterized protein n=1 Tax=Orientia chuto str. Dubai TaxID=1359168 RepID=A0A0F3MLA2_9RICK|nr:hypothetical protein [Candidatus Orientia mediorientalis]KJV56436.1 hypothetical protein OCHUTO_0458 [Orientia chuto str. Dubai]
MSIMGNVSNIKHNIAGGSSKHCIVAISKEIVGLVKLLGFRAYEMCGSIFLRPLHDGGNSYSNHLYDSKECSSDLVFGVSNPTEALESITEHCTKKLTLKALSTIVTEHCMSTQNLTSKHISTDISDSVGIFEIVNGLFNVEQYTNITCKVVKNCAKEYLIEAYCSIYNLTMLDENNNNSNDAIDTTHTQCEDNNYVPLIVIVGAITTSAALAAICYLNRKSNKLEHLLNKKNDLLSKNEDEYAELQSIPPSSDFTAEPFNPDTQVQLSPIYARVQKKNKLQNNPSTAEENSQAANVSSAISVANIDSTNNIYDDVNNQECGIHHELQNIYTKPTGEMYLDCNVQV